MANHTIDCRYCGEDQRVVGANCCAESKAEEEARLAANKKWHEGVEKRLAAYDIRYCWDGRVSADEVLRALDKLSKTS